jgi:methanogenic corrinoid protein MtbC1
MLGSGEIVALSAIMLATIMGMKVVQMIMEKNINLAIMRGGAPVTNDVTELFEADGCGDSAGNAVQEAIKMTSRLRDM